MKKRKETMLSILFITGASHKPWMSNMNHFQRVYFLSRQARLTVFGRKGSDFSLSAAEGTEIIRAPFKSKLGMIFTCFFWMIIKGRSKHYDVILTEPSKLCICGFFGKMILGGKWVMDAWDIPFRSMHPLHKYISRVDRKIARFLFKFVDLFILALLPEFEFAEFGVPKEKMLPLKNAIWLDKKTKEPPRNIYKRNGAFKIFCMRSQFTQDMGLDLLSQAFDTLNKTHPDIELTVVGTIPNRIRPQIKLLEGHTNVFFCEFMEHEEMMSLAASSNVCVVPFRNTMDLAQTHPIKILEYLSCGAVVLAANLPGIASIIKHGENGLLFQADNPCDLAGKILLLYDNPELRTFISKNARESVKQYNCVEKNQVIIDRLHQLVSEDKIT